MSRFQGTRFGGPFLGSLFGFPFWVLFLESFLGLFCGLLLGALQVLGFWQWSLFLRTKAAEHGRNLVYINIDESSMLQTCPSRRGVCIPCRLWPRKRVPVGAPYQKRRRGAVSFRGPLVTPRGLQGHALSTVPRHSGHSHFSRHCSSESVWLEPKPSAA